MPEVLVPFMGGRTLLPFVREKPVNVESKLAAKKEAKAGGGAAAAAAPAAEAAAAGASPAAPQ